jgi:hypothetical protein
VAFECFFISDSMEEGVLFVKEQVLSLEEASDVLRKAPSNVVSIPPRKPKGGQVFLFKAEDVAQEGTVKENGLLSSL